MGTLPDSFLVDGKYSVHDLMDINQLEEIFKNFTEATGFTIGFLDHPDMNVIIATGWRDICTKFHRTCLSSAKICKNSNTRLINSLKYPGQLLIDKCENGLIDCATPIFIKGVHIATLATGQFLFEQPDINRFKDQAKKFGFEQEAYLNSLKEIPVVSEKRVMETTKFLGSLAALISEMGYAHLETKEKAYKLELEMKERKKAEEKRLELERQILQTQKLESLGLLASGVAHDFNNLLTGVLGNAHLAIRSPELDENIEAFLFKIISAGKQAAELCRQMLAYAGKGKFTSQKIDIAKLIDEMVQILEVSISKKVALSYYFEKNVPAIKCDPSQIQQVLMNLIINASQAIGDTPGKISVSVSNQKREEQEYVLIEVKDDGCGMSKESQEKIFDPFFSTKKTGHGLGLAAVQGIIKSYNGFIDVSSEPGRGTTFKVLIPAAKGKSEQLERIDPQIENWRSSGKILIADDAEEAQFIGQQILEHIGFKVTIVNNGKEAIRAFEKAEQAGEPFKGTILDVNMPEVGGINAFRRIREISPNVPIIMASGYGEQEILVQLGKEKKIGIIPKPFDFEIIATKLKGLLEE
jgi:signal transduction histidine kinase/ActR/RegA family two-component response regulator